MSAKTKSAPWEADAWAAAKKAKAVIAARRDLLEAIRERDERSNFDSNLKVQILRREYDAIRQLRVAG